jgi:DNA-binding CsgD family transcriptional regulator
MLQITPLERAALQLLADGRAPREIAERLRLSESTVDARLALLYARMGVAGPSDAIATAHRRGLIVVADEPALA